MSTTATNPASSQAGTATAAKPDAPSGTGPEGIRLGTSDESAAAASTAAGAAGAEAAPAHPTTAATSASTAPSTTATSTAAASSPAGAAAAPAATATATPATTTAPTTAPTATTATATTATATTATATTTTTAAAAVAAAPTDSNNNSTAQIKPVVKEKPKGPPPLDASKVRLVPLTHYPPQTQSTLERNVRRIAGKPYARHLRTSLSIYEDVVEHIRQPMPKSGFLDVLDGSRLLERGYLPSENGWLALDDGGGAYVSSLVRFGRRTTGEMIRWWFWWHAQESERFALWHPHSHVRVVDKGGSAVRATASHDGVDAGSHVQRWLGATHRRTEQQGGGGRGERSVHVRYLDPAKYGLPWEQLRAAGYEAAVCAELRDGWEPRLKTGDAVHLWRRTPAGDLELRSRYWLGAGDVRLDLPGRRSVKLDLAARVLGVKALTAGADAAYGRFVHDQAMFTNLAEFLPDLYADWEAGRV